jgi:hypothetical protein
MRAVRSIQDPSILKRFFAILENHSATMQEQVSAIQDEDGWIFPTFVARYLENLNTSKQFFAALESQNIALREYASQVSNQSSNDESNLHCAPPLIA